MWDKTLPALVEKTPSALADKIVVADFKSAFAMKGDYHHWPEEWAADTMQQSSEAYKGIVFKSAEYVPDPRHPGKTMLKIMIDLPGGTAQYKKDQKVRTQSQLTKAAVHLAQLLNAIKYK